MKKAINININKDDQNINDYLYVWSEISERPSKTSIFYSFERNSFDEILSEYSAKNISSNSEIYPTEVESFENVKRLDKITDSIYVSYVVYDIRSEENFVGDISFLFKNDSIDTINEIISKLENLIEVTQSEDHIIDSFFLLGLDNSGFEITPIDYLSADYENIDLFFNNEVIRQSKKLSKKLDKDNKGISVIYGTKGCGKSTLACSILKNVAKKKIYIPSTMIDTTINNPDFKNFLLKNKNLVIIIDDCEFQNSDIIFKNNLFTRNILQLVEGIDSDNYGLQLLLIFNSDIIEDIDDSLVNSNELIDIIEVKELSIEKSKDLCKFLKKNKKIKKETKLVDIIKKRTKISEESKIGFE